MSRLTRVSQHLLCGSQVFAFHKHAVWDEVGEEQRQRRSAKALTEVPPEMAGAEAPGSLAGTPGNLELRLDSVRS